MNRLGYAAIGPLTLMGALVWGLCCLASTDASTDTGGAVESSTRGSEFSEFQVLIERNIFDSTRQPRRTFEKREESPTFRPKTVRLIGTWISQDYALALFDGDIDTPREGFSLGTSIVGHQIAEIRTDAVVLLGEHGTLRVPVGAGLVSKEDGTWTVTTSPQIERPVAPSAGSSQAESGTEIAQKPSESAAPPESDAVARMRERRRRELGL